MPKPKTILLAALVPLLVGFLVSRNVTHESAQLSDPISTPVPATSTPSPVTGNALDAAGNSDSYREYALSLPELEGLPANAPVGTVLEVWAAWDPPITKSPRFQRLVTATLEEIVPGLSAESPATAILRVRTRDLDELLFADRYGSLSVALLP